jgi:hypothetical protein
LIDETDKEITCIPYREQFDVPRGRLTDEGFDAMVSPSAHNVYRAAARASADLDGSSRVIRA